MDRGRSTTGDQGAPRRRRGALGRTLLAPLLFGFLAVPACFFVLPPQEAIDRWNVATGAMVPVALVIVVVTGVRGAKLRASLFVGLTVVVGAVLANVVLAALGPVHDRRYCEAHQRYARQTLKQAAGADGAPSSCSASADVVKAAFAGTSAEHFSFGVEQVGEGCAYSAIGEGYQAGCDVRLVVRPDGARDMVLTMACHDKC